jgi:hypothetical protein
METTSEPLLSEVIAAAIARALFPYTVATTMAGAARGTHLYTRHPSLPLSLCGALARVRASRLHTPLTLEGLRGVTCARCLINIEQRLAPR